MIRTRVLGWATESLAVTPHINIMDLKGIFLYVCMDNSVCVETSKWYVTGFPTFAEMLALLRVHYMHICTCGNPCYVSISGN